MQFSSSEYTPRSFESFDEYKSTKTARHNLQTPQDHNEFCFRLTPMNFTFLYHNHY